MKSGSLLEKYVIIFLVNEDLRLEVQKKINKYVPISRQSWPDTFSGALNFLSTYDTDLFICDSAYATHRTAQQFGILISRYRHTRVFILCNPEPGGTNGENDVPSWLAKHERVHLCNDPERLGEVLDRMERPNRPPAGPPPACDARDRSWEIPAARPAPDQITRLTPRQTQILYGLAGGLTNKEIGRNLGIQETTVKVQLKLMYRVLRVANRTQAAILLAQKDLEAEGQAQAPIPRVPRFPLSNLIDNTANARRAG